MLVGARFLRVPRGADTYVLRIIIYVGYEYWIYKYKHIWRVGLGVGVTAACFDRRWESPAGCVLALGTSSFAAWPAQGPSGSEGPGREGGGSAETVYGRPCRPWVLHGRTVGNTREVLLGTAVGQCWRWSPTTQPGASPTHLRWRMAGRGWGGGEGPPLVVTHQLSILL